MYAINLIDVVDTKTNYGILCCENKEITINAIQEKIYEIKKQLENEDIDWIVEDIIHMLPDEWLIKLQITVNTIFI